LDGRTSLAAEVCYAVDVDLTALGSVDGRAEVDGSALESGGGSESCESGEGEGGELHFGGVGLVVGGVDGLRFGCNGLGLDVLMDGVDVLWIVRNAGRLVCTYTLLSYLE
jgi:hypothetical protein